jgi:tripartite-type tricarboxylate transporter receptor subunit TctC
VLVFSALPTNAADVFVGKTISIYVGSAAGGGYDIYSRVIGRHLGRFIPGRPAVIVQNMPGAGGGKAAAFIANVAPRDGTAIGAIAPGVIVGPLLD